ncbi:GNAT family N-acetyltransferase [Nonomuraea sp. NPDC050536]|uniref:GNAT family N-acetyltransferase n=1 Tax=Nonomuraea sp. NPDC050536 TaxID=3364366 RepID=UPI0037CCA003
MDFTTFQASAADADTIGEIHASSWLAAYGPFFAPEFFAQAVRHRRTKWPAVLAERKGAVLLGALGGRPLAFAFIGESPTRPGSAEIHSCFAHPDGWGTGVTAFLMAAAIDRLREDGYRHVHLWTLRDTAQSRRFYAKCGFAESGETRGWDFGDGNLLPQVEYGRGL